MWAVGISRVRAVVLWNNSLLWRRSKCISVCDALYKSPTMLAPQHHGMVFVMPHHHGLAVCTFVHKAFICRWPHVLRCCCAEAGYRADASPLG